jgi:hypothetical protein
MTETNVRDFENGQKDKKAGYYDKWYRWNRKDDGKAYDDGFNSVSTDALEINIIECMHNMEHIPTLEEKLIKYL